MTNFLFTGGHRLVVRGVCEEVIERLVALGAASPHWRSRSVPQIPFDQQAFRTLLVEMLLEAGVSVLLETSITGVIKEGDSVSGVMTESKGGRQAIRCGVAVDATGDADLAAFAGAPYRNTPPDSGSLLFLMSHVDLDQTASYFEQHPGEWQQYSDRVTPLEDFLDNWHSRGIFHLPHGGGRNMRLVQEAIARGDYLREKGACRDLDVFGVFAYRGTDQVCINSCNFRIDHLDPKTHSTAEMEARALIPVVAGFLRAHMPGFSAAIVADSASVIGVRFTRWIDAGFDLTSDDTASGSQFSDVVGVSAAFDRHPRGGVIHPACSVDLPYRIMLPRGVENLIVASGKSVSTNPRGLVRGQVQCYLLGQAGGVAAAVAAHAGVAPRTVYIGDVQRALLDQNVYLGESERLAALGFG